MRSLSVDMVCGPRHAIARAAALEFEGLGSMCAGDGTAMPSMRWRALNGIEVVYHLAKCEGEAVAGLCGRAISSPPACWPRAPGRRYRRFIYTGTIASYASDDARDMIDNRTPVDPAIARRNHYARSKAACEALLQGMQRERRYRW